ncbi:WD repeat-containing protein 7 isoform X2 [Octopus bimaculoides]|uniref:WD repeat-containing protein 7 isoform X2 n=1 Tax=Octopus bimaculoides TaxID=37653 RepID=UPI0022E8531C|nr:WD repeat-containing protein 7 isoform X2 [Octopus bimaculoides]
MGTTGNLVVPVVLWGHYAPTHCISAITMNSQLDSIVTGCNDGQIVIWEVTRLWQIYPRHMLFGHTASISCLSFGNEQHGFPYVVSSSENGEMCLWDTSDGRCLESTKLPLVHTCIQSYRFRGSQEIRLVCNGFYPEIHVMDPFGFEIIFSLHSKVTPNWISACCILRPVKGEDDVVVAVSNSGAVKVWSLSGEESKLKPVYEDESKQIRCLNAQTLHCCPYNQRTVLIVCSKSWQVYNYDLAAGVSAAKDALIYDASDFTLLCSESNRNGEHWVGGDFISVDRVVVWNNEGKGYLYKLPTNTNPESPDYHAHYQPSSPQAYYVLNTLKEQQCVCSPAMDFQRGGKSNDEKFLLCGNSEGQILVWNLPEISEPKTTCIKQDNYYNLPTLYPKVKTALQDLWDENPATSVGLLDQLCEQKRGLEITATIHIPSQGFVVCGRQDGSLIIAPATKCVILQLLHKKELTPNKISVKVLQGHDGRVTCLLYPCNESTRYESAHLISGGTDFSVILWDMFQGIKLHTFTVHGGEITQLLVPPNSCNPRILTAICSVASDHSVTLLSLRERKCIMLAGRHLFPVRVIKWRPLDDFMVVGCTDGTVYVWQMETGHLDRCVHGIIAEEILNNCDENAVAVEALTNPSITLTQALKRRNLATFRNLAQQKLTQNPGPTQAQPLISAAPKPELVKPQASPLLIQGIRTNTNNPDAHLLFFDTESLIVQLLTEEYALMTPGEIEAFNTTSPTMERLHNAIQPEVSEAAVKIAGLIAKVKDKAENVGHKIQNKVEATQYSPQSSPKQSNRPSVTSITSEKHRPNSIHIKSIDITMETAQLFMSCLHAWGLDPDLDKLCHSKLGLLRPKRPVSFGLFSRHGHMSLLLPGGHKKQFRLQQNLLLQNVISNKKPTLIEQVRQKSMEDLITFDDLEMDSSTENDDNESDAALAMNSSNTGDSFAEDEIHRFSTKSRWQISQAITTQHLLSVISVANTLMSMNYASFLEGSHLKRIKRRKKQQSLSTMAQTDPDSDEEGERASIQQAQIKQGWSLLAALHCVLLPELVGSGNYQAPQVEMLARRWQDRCLEIREAAQALLLAELRRIGPEGRKKVVDEWAPHLPTYVDPSVSLMNENLHKGEGDEEEEDEEEQILTEGEPPANKLSSNFESRRKQATAIIMLGVVGAEFGHEIEPSKRKPDTDQKKLRRAGQEGFSLSNYSLARLTSHALTFLLSQPASQRIPAYTPIRRASIDLLGRGFTVWEPYLDVSAVLLGLLELCVDADRLVPNMTFGLPLTPYADASRTARHSLSLIATARPPAFIITMAKEVARYNTLAQNAQPQHPQLMNLVLVRAKAEILRVVELLVDKMPNDVAELLIEVMDVVVHCLDLSQLKSKGLQEVFPAICRFGMVTYCSHNKRIWVGAKNGTLAFYELKPHSKCTTISAHTGPVIAVMVSPDGKHLASYSHADSKLKFWQTASSNIFGIGPQQTKCVKQLSTPPCHVTPLTNLLKLVRLVWLDNRTVVLLTVDGTEAKYTI